jgi:WD40 repeat protein/serine/threonine protein kinase
LWQLAVQEVVALGRLGHDACGRPFYAMRFIEGDSLGEAIAAFHRDEGLKRDREARGARLRELRRRFTDVCDAVGYAHSRGVLHRDLKPANIMLGPYGETLVVDWGLAKPVGTALAGEPAAGTASGPAWSITGGPIRLSDPIGSGSDTVAGSALGTPAYASPEQVGGALDRLGPATDIYGLGATLYTLLTGRAPVEGGEVGAVLRRVQQGAIPPPRSIDPTIPRPLEAICQKAMALKPEDRYPSARALAEDVMRWLDDEPVSAWREPLWERSRRWARRHRPAVASAAVAMVAVALLSLLYADRQTRLADVERSRADEQLRHASEQTRAAADLKSALVESNRRLAVLNFERGQAAFEKGQVGPGLLWMVETLQNATDAGDPVWKHAALINLSAWRPVYPSLRAVLSHAGPVRKAAFSPDGKVILSGSWDKTARLWDVATGQPIGQPMQHEGWVLAAAFSPDGRTILTGSDDKTARLWDATSGRPIGKPMVHQGRVRAVAFRPDGKVVLTASHDQTARLWDAASGRPLGEPMVHQGWVNAVALSPDGKVVVTCSDDKTARLWDAASGRPLGEPMVHRDEVGAVAFSPDGKAALTGSYKMARLWDAANGQPVGEPMEHQDWVQAVAFSPDGKAILTGSDDKTARLWDTATTRPIGKPMVHQGRVQAVAFSPDGKAVLTGSEDRTARLWDGVTGHPLGQPLEHQDAVRSVAFSPDGRAVLTSGDDRTARLWDAVTGQVLGKPWDGQGFICAATFSPDGTTILTGGHRAARQWNAATEQPVGKPMVHQGRVWAVAFSPDGRTILTGSDDKTARLWDAASGRPIGKPIVHRDEVWAVAFSPDGKAILTGSEDRTARLWDAASGRPIGPPMVHQDPVRSVAFRPDGKAVLTGSDDRTARLWDLVTGHPLGQPLEHPTAVSAVAFSPDGKSFLTGGGDGTARLWDATTGRPIGKHMELRRPIRSVAFSPDGTTILTGGYETARLWDAASGRPIGPTLEHQDTDWAVAFSPDGTTILTDSGILRLWDLPAALPEDPLRLAAWVETLTGLELDDQGSIRPLDHAAWEKSRERLEQLHGSPPGRTERLLDPILFGPDPAARGHAYEALHRWPEAEAAFTEAIRARLFNSSVWGERGRFYLARSQPEKAAANFREAILHMPGDLAIRYPLIPALLAARDAHGLRRAISDLLDRFGSTTDAQTSNNVAWYCTLAPGSVADSETPVRLADVALKGFPPHQKHFALNTLGAALYRAGRFEDAIRRLEEGIQLQAGQSLPQDWVFLAMAHHRLGHHDEARRWLDRFQNYQPSPDVSQFWTELEIRLLRSEAEAVVLYDPVFPADPFAH